MGLTHWMTDLLDLACPGRCAACGVAVDQGLRFCGDCDFTLTAMENRPQCLRCGSPVSFEHSPCQRCGGRGYRVFGQVVRLSVFESPVRELIRRFKFYHGWSIGELLAERAMRLERMRRVLEETDVLVPVPLHPWRQIWRGFNQADVFAGRLGKLSGKRLVRPAIRIRATAPQSLQPRRDKQENLRDAFALRSAGPIRGKRVTIVDDVFTTASTLKSLASVLKEAEPAALNVLCIAIADPKGRAFEAV